MSFFSQLTYVSQVFSDAIRLVVILLKYDDHSIVNYYREQGAKVGDDCEFHIRSKWNEPELIEIGNHVLVAQGVLFHTHDGGVWVMRQDYPHLRLLGKIVVEDNCLIGANAQIFPNVRIGTNSIIGAGSVVIADVPPNSIVMGVPARVIGSTLKYKERNVAKLNEKSEGSQKIDT